MNQIQWPTAAVIIAGIGLLIACVLAKSDRDTIAAVGAAFVVVAGGMQSLRKAGDP